MLVSIISICILFNLSLVFLKALRRLRASSQVDEDIEEMRAEERAQQSESSISIMELICSPTLRAPLIIGIVMQLSQQLSGINAVSILISRIQKISIVIAFASFLLLLLFNSEENDLMFFSNCNFLFLFIHSFFIFFCTFYTQQFRYFIIPLHSS